MSERPKFAIVREDPALELEVVRLFGASAVLLPASGGCTALSLAQQFKVAGLGNFARAQ